MKYFFIIFFIILIFAMSFFDIYLLSIFGLNNWGDVAFIMAYKLLIVLFTFVITCIYKENF